MAGQPTITLSRHGSDVAVLTFDAPDKGANVLSRSVLEELSAHLDALEKRTDLAGLVIRSGKEHSFIAGADLREFAASLNAPKEEVVKLCRAGHALFGRLSKCPFVTVAAIDGVCLGGGAELAIWCDRRVAADHSKTEIGFPEVKLGLFPGWGGCSRMPRMVGLANAVEMITSGEPISPRDAYKMGLVSDVIPSERLLDAAVNLIRTEQQTKKYLEDRQGWSGPIEVNETELGFLAATASAVIRQQTKGQYPAPEAALEVMLETAAEDLESALQREAEGMARLFGSPVNTALINVFFLDQRNKKDKGVDRPEVTPREVKQVGVIGAGIMGGGIAAGNLRRGIPVVLTDASPEALVKGAQKIIEEASFNRETKGPDAVKAIELAPLLNVSRADQEFAVCDLVIEAIVERMDVKKQVHARLEPLLADDAILASNTSTIPITQLAEGLKRPERFCGIHFFNPVRRMKLVEVIRGEKTSDETAATAVAYAKRIGKSPIVVKDGPGFLVNRLLFPYMNEALELLVEGASVDEVEKAAKRFGMPMGPITLFDMVGLDTALYAGGVMRDAFPERFTDNPLLPELVKQGRLGQKSGAGFFSHQAKKREPQPDPTFGKLLEQHRRGQKKFSQDELQNRLFLPMLLEATRVLEAKLVRDARDADLALIYGIGFPPFRGGLMFWADTLGAAKMVEMLKPFESLGERYQPTPLLLEAAKSNKNFYSM
jgi:3-hydroxyacyl-CoA dehydrogenase/enoyl-CoA hydratase/3-hydroxybutyryl-CoA epimerase/3-hydroxyacyl-CoA dehydrogenase/enoyl-CoA hydratase/3-hydroxybutyryl-CoA epimerase/enoyl-CoA isomerase